MLKEKALLALSTSKINDGTNFKDNVGSTPTANCTRKKKLEHWGVHVETINSQQVKVKRAMSKILKAIPDHVCGIELRFMPQMSCDVDSKQKQRLRNAMMKHRQALANLVEFMLTEFEEIGTLVKI